MIEKYENLTRQQAHDIIDVIYDLTNTCVSVDWTAPEGERHSMVGKLEGVSIRALIDPGMSMRIFGTTEIGNSEECD